MKLSPPMPTDLILATATPSHDEIGILADAVIKAAEPTAEGKPAARTFEMVAYNGGELRLAGWPHPVVVDIAGLDTRESHRPILIDHTNDMEHLLGQTDAVTKSATNVTVRGRIHPISNTAKQVVALHDDGFRFQASIGAKPLAHEFIAAGKTGDANGRAFNGPLYIVRKSVLGEVSFVRLGADDSTSARIAATAAEGNAMTFEEWLTARGFKLADLSEPQKEAMQKLFDAETATAKVTPPPAGTANASADTTVVPPGGIVLPPGTHITASADDPIASMRAGVAAESKRINAINGIHATFGNRHPDIYASAVENGLSADQFKLKLYESAPNVTATGGGRSHQRNNDEGAVILASLCLSGGINAKTVEAGIPAADRERVMNEATSGRYRGTSIHSLMDATIRASGGAYHGTRGTDDFIRAAFNADQEIRASGFTTMSFSGILTNTANKQLIDAYNGVKTVWQNIAGVRPLSDFKPVTLYRLDMTGSFKPLGPDGEIKHSGLTDSGYTVQASTQATIITLTREMIRNDDLGAFLSIPKGIGLAAATSVERSVMKLILTNTDSFFAVGNKNLQSGAGTAFSIDGVEVAQTAFANQVGPNKQPILVEPDRLLVPTTLTTKANALFNNDALVVVTTGNTAAATTTMNPHAGKYQPYTSAYLNNTAVKDENGKALPNQSDTAYYLFCDPNVRAAIYVGFLDGKQTPTIESQDAQFDQLGVQWRGYIDFGVGFGDPTAVQKIAGA